MYPVLYALHLSQSCKPGRAFRVGLGFGPGSGLTFKKTLGLFRARYDAYKKLSKNKIILLPYIYSYVDKLSVAQL